MKQPEKWRRSFRYAYEGIKYALATQRNLKFHFFAAFVVLLMALYVHISKTEILFILMAVTLMIVTELINTAIEKAVDLAMPDRHPVAKIAKDVAAASVLVSAVFAAVTGMIVFYDPLVRLVYQVKTVQRQPVTSGTIWIMLSIVILTVIVIETRFAGSRWKVRPSLLTAFAFAVASVIALIANHTAVILLSYTMAILVNIALYDKRSRTLASLVLGAVIGAGTALLAGLLLQ